MLYDQRRLNRCPLYRSHGGAQRARHPRLWASVLACRAPLFATLSILVVVGLTRDLLRPSRTSSTTGGSLDSQRFRVTHPFHPLSGNEYELVGYGHTWGEHRVFFREPGQTRVRSLPASWTDVNGADPFLVRSAGRSHFRAEDLLKLALLLSELQHRA